MKGKTILITGGSRGIGQAISSKLSAEGANIAVIAKETPANDLASTVQRIEAAGGKILAIDADLNEAGTVKEAITKTLSHFGSIDGLVNNVAAFCFENTSSINLEQFDALISLNLRATFLMSQACVPHLMRSTNPHIINISPPLNMQPEWFRHHTAFTLSKYAMSMCTLGMSEEFKGSRIAINSLWPQTTIATPTIKAYFSDTTYAGSRWPTIMADAAYVLIQRNANQCTGNFFIDEELLRESGVKDFSHYSVDSKASLIQDLFVPARDDLKPLTIDDYK